MITWKVVPHAPKYSISDTGDVMNTKTGRILKPLLSSDGYRFFCLGYKNQHRASRLVADAFIKRPNFVSIFEVAHNDGSRDNDCVKNLRWATRTENQRDRFFHGTHIAGQNARDAKLTNEQVMDIRNKLTWRRGEIQRLANQYGLSYNSMRNICHGKTYKEVYFS